MRSLLKLSLIYALALSLDAKTYNVDELISMSLKNSPDIKIAVANYEASQKRYSTAFASYLPKVDLSLSGGVIDKDSVTDNLLLGKITAQQLIYDFEKTGGSVKSAKYQSDAFMMDNKQKISDKIRDVKVAYYNTLKAYSLIRVHKENVKLNKAQAYRAKKYFQAGIKTKIDVSDAKVALIKSKIDLNKAKYNLESSYANLDKIVGFTQFTRDYKLTFSPFELNHSLSAISEYPFSLKDAIAYAYDNKPEIASYRSKVQSAKSEIATIQSEYFPSLYLYGDYTKQKVDKLSLSLPQESWQTTLNLQWNLYQGGATNAKKEEKRINKSITDAQLVLAQLTVKQNVTDAYINFSEKKDQVELANSLLVVSNEKFEQASKRYENGLTDFIELQQARQEYIDAKANLVITYFDYYVAIANLDNAIGK